MDRTPPIIETVYSKVYKASQIKKKTSTNLCRKNLGILND